MYVNSAFVVFQTGYYYQDLSRSASFYVDGENSDACMVWIKRVFDSILRLK